MFRTCVADIGKHALSKLEYFLSSSGRVTKIYYEVPRVADAMNDAFGSKIYEAYIEVLTTAKN